jgi:RHS repeat-associated protein
MGCLKLTYRPENLHLWKETAIEKSDHADFLPQGEKKAGEKSCDNYYAFGLTFNSYTRQNSVPNTIKLFQGQEHIDDLGLNWDAFKWRNHQPDIGRFFNIDPLASKYVYNSPYAFSENRVINGRELEGLEWVNSTGQKIYEPTADNGKGAYTQNATTQDKQLGSALQKTETGSAQFSKLVNSEHPISIEVNSKKELSTNQEGKPQMGTTRSEAHLEGDKVVPEKSIITLNTETIKYGVETNKTVDGGKEGMGGLSQEQGVAATLGHEIEHASKEGIVADATKGNSEPAAVKAGDSIIRESKENNKNDKKD